MLKVLENFSLKKYNTFDISASCKFFAQIENTDDLVELAGEKELLSEKRFVLGGGSNVLFKSDFDGLIIFPANKGIEIIEEDDDKCIVRVAAGEVWDDFVAWTVERNLYGVENLSYIPGNVGAAPVQNIGAYGVEAKDCIYAADAYNLETGEFVSFSNAECKFSYRNSIFKGEYKNRLVIYRVSFLLSKKEIFHLDYRDVKEQVAKSGVVSLQNIRQTITAIRRSKLPEPELEGNGGSFFKNPVISVEKHSALKAKFPNMVSFHVDDHHVKIAAGWLIDHLGWKGRRYNDAAVHDKQALVLVNKGSATGKDIITLAKKIQDDVADYFEIVLEPEVIFL